MRTIREFLATVPAPYVVIATVGGVVLYLAERATPWAPFGSYGNGQAVAFTGGVLALWAIGLAATPLLALRWPVGSALIAGAPLALGAASEHQWPFVIFAALVVIAVMASWRRPRTALALGLVALTPVASVALGRSEMIVPYGARIDSVDHGGVDLSLVVGYLIVMFLIAVIAVVLRVHGMRTLAKGAVGLPPVAVGSTIEASPATMSGERVAELSPREHEVFLQLAAGRSNAEIADALHIGVETVKSHVAEVLRKLDLRDRIQAVVFAYENGFVGSRQS